MAAGGGRVGGGGRKSSSGPMERASAYAKSLTTQPLKGGLATSLPEWPADRPSRSPPSPRPWFQGVGSRPAEHEVTDRVPSSSASDLPSPRRSFGARTRSRRGK